MVRNIAESAMWDVIKKRIAKTPSNQDVTTYLSGLLEDEFGRDLQAHSRAWQLQHNDIQDHLVRAILPPVGKVVMNSSISRTDSQLQPDIIITNEDQKKIMMVDVTVPFKDRTLAFHNAHVQKVEK
ncbi:hypothetical protein KIL84_013127 [Mauremys mutica]|uniref:Uncharacterized protein n=1 Tax=Mauremys mutica TaxID=74926 RepID=A0A9D4AN19_9SAUR|nr:hypothetical protein KIL84_013127 [Mauremys mutica]